MILNDPVFAWWAVLLYREQQLCPGSPGSSSVAVPHGVQGDLSSEGTSTAYTINLPVKELLPPSCIGLNSWKRGIG